MNTFFQRKLKMNCVPVGEYFGDELVKVWIWSEGALGHQLLATGGTLCQPETHQTYCTSSVADPKCLSRIPDPDFFSIPVPRSNTNKKEGGEKFFCTTFLVAINLIKLKMVFYLKR
jgi:hypothetical protein